MHDTHLCGVSGNNRAVHAQKASERDLEYKIRVEMNPEISQYHQPSRFVHGGHVTW